MTAQELIHAREVLGFTQSDLADRLGLPLVEVQKLESGNGEIPTIHRLAVDMVRLQVAREKMSVAVLSGELQNLVNHPGRRLYPN